MEHRSAPYWQRYVSERLDGRFGVRILKDGLTEEEALDLEGRLISKHGEDFVNMINPGRQMDYQAIETSNAKREESQRLTELAKKTAKDDPEAAVDIAEQTLDLVHEYSQIVTETGLIAELSSPGLGGPTVGDPNVIYRLAQCLKQTGDLQRLVREIDDYFARYPDAADHYVGRTVLKLRNRTAERLADQ